MERVLVALSGGVDSAVAALLLKNEGYEVSCVFMRTWMDEASQGVFADCPWKADMESAREVADYLSLPFEVINLIDDYREKVVEYLVEGYKSGITPNPDIMCNREIKFGVLLDYAISKGFDKLATGHYCRVKTRCDGNVELLEGMDPNKDQSYFLAMVKQEALKRVLFPIGEYNKAEIRAIAKEYNLPNADRKDSQGICFLGKVPINEFLKQYIPESPGPIVDTAGKYLGEHKGLHRYTIGQRKGIGIPSNRDFEKYVVVAKDYESNTLRVAFDKPDAPGLYTKEAMLRDLHFINEPITDKIELLARPRYRDPAQEVVYVPLQNGQARIIFKEEQRALASGQVLALYQGNVLIGSGYYI